MKYLRMIGLFALFFAFMLPCLVSADVDTPDVLITGSPDFIVSGSTYGQHETEVMEMDKAVNNLIVGVDMERLKKPSSDAMPDSDMLKLGRWTATWLSMVNIIFLLSIQFQPVS